MRRRPGLLLGAAVTVAVPGALTVLAVVAQQHAADQPASAAAAAAAGAGGVSGPVPVSPPTAHAAVRNAVASTQRTSGAMVTVLSTGTAHRLALGTRLLDKAVDAGRQTSYQGTEVLTQSGIGGEVKMTAQVWHRGGGLTFTQTSDGTHQRPAHAAFSYDPNHSSPEGVFGLTKPLVSLLGKHYVAAYRGTGVCFGKSAQVVAVYRFDGSLAAQFWLDRRTLVPLRRELFAASGQLVSEDAFTRVRFGKLPRKLGALTEQQAKKRAAARQSWTTATDPARLLRLLAVRGLQLPGSLPGGLSGGLPLYAAKSTGTGAGQVIELEYSDGLYVDSLFVQQGTLTPDMTGWQPVSLNGHQVYVSGRSVTWAGGGDVYTMVADAPPQVVARDVAALPPSAPPGILNRIGRGLGRLVNYANPFS